MCDATAIMLGTTAISTAAGITGDVMAHGAQADAAAANAESAREAAAIQMQQLALQQQQEAKATSRSIFMADFEGRRAEAITRVSAGESGVEGASIDVILADINRQAAMAQTDAQTNLEASGQQRNMERRAVGAQMQSRINSVGAPSGAALGVSILGRGASAGSSIAGHYGRIPRVE